MNKLITALAAASLLISTQAPAFATDQGKAVKPLANVTIKNSNDNTAKIVAFTVGAIIAGAVIANRVQADKDHRRNKCTTWRSDCHYGSARACYKFDAHC